MIESRRYRSRRAEARSSGVRGEVGASVAGEVRGGYDPGESDTPAVGDVGEALTLITRGLDALAGLDLRDEIDRDVADAAIAAQRQMNRLQAQQTRLVERVRVSGVHRLDGSVSVGSWYADHTSLDASAARRIARRAQRLGHYEQLQQAFQAGDISSDHVDPIVRATTSRRFKAVRQAEGALVTLARHGTPTDVRRAVKLIRDLVDPDGTDTEPLDPGQDERRELFHNATIDGLGDLRGTLTSEASELLGALLETLATPDSKDVPNEQRRSSAQIRHDAFLEILRRAAGATHETKNGARPHVNLMIDLWTLLGRPGAATFESRLAHTGIIDDDVALGLLRQWLDQDGFLTNVVLTGGPYRPVAFGRTKRTLPDWLRPILEHLHVNCRWPCDRPARWAEADHTLPWGVGGETEWDRSLPSCKGDDNHHDLHTNGGWRTDYDPETGIATFTSPTGRQIRTHPPPRRC